ncbi:NAD(P)-dependent oxidoreductase [Pseudorhodoplanes sp.]|uniref:NAD(P)-dependent oxidoreductase n=1 Tax=Pseudorhodoplanes sp. TaxID=1934341 RepID=UPI003D0C3FEC
MQTIGFVGVGLIGLPICEHLLKKGHTVIGYRRSSLAEFEKLGGIRAKSPADVGAQSDIVFTCLPTDAALEEVINGVDGLMKSARPGQIIVEFGSHPVRFKEQYVKPLADKGAVFLDGEVAGTPGMIAARKGVIYLGGPADAVKGIEPIIADFADLCVHLGDFGAATKVKLVSNFLVALHIAGTAQAMALAMRTGVDIDLLIKAVASGSGGSSAFAIRAPWMAERRFMPPHGSAAGLARYLDNAKEMAVEAGLETELLDSLIDIYARAVPKIGDRDVAAILEHFETTTRQN